MHRHHIDVANKYDSESDFATVEVVVERPAEIKGQATTMLPGVQRLRRARPRLDHVVSGIYRHVNGEINQVGAAELGPHCCFGCNYPTYLLDGSHRRVVAFFRTP